MKRVDCPHCGAQLDPALADRQAQVQCAQCGRQLRLMRKRDLRQAQEQAAGTLKRPTERAPEKAPAPFPPPVPEPTPRATSRRPESLLPPPSRIPVPGRPAAAADDSPIESVPSIALESRPSVSTENLLEELTKRKARTRLWMSAALVAFTAISVASILWLLNSDSTQQVAAAADAKAGAAEVAAKVSAAGEKEEAASPTASAGTGSDESKRATESEPAGSEATAEPAPEPLKPIAWGELNSVGRRDLEKLWTQLHPYVFRLVVKKSNSERTISGLLLDSRGYLVTSLSAIEGATSIVAAPAPNDPLAELPADALKDEVRGVLAVDRARDLALLQINRRLVNVVSGLQPSEKLLVPGRWLIQTAAVGPERLGWMTESKVVASSPEKFPPALQQEIERRELDCGPYWPQHQLQLTSSPGAGLFTDDGRLAGINTGIRHEGGQLIAEAKLVFELVKQAKEPAGPLSSMSKQAKPVAESTESAGGEGKSGEATSGAGPGGSPFAPGHEAEPLAKRLAEAAFACEAFGWLPGEEGTQPAELSDALVAWREAREVIRSRRLFPEDSKLFSQQVAHWTGRINATLLSLDREQSAEWNRKAWASLKGESAQTLVLFVRVALQPGTSPRIAGADTATLQLLGTDQYLIAEVDPEAAPLLPDSEWLVVVTVDAGEEVLVNPQPGKQANARKSTACKEISEVKSIGFRVDPLKSEPQEPDGDDSR